MRQKIIYLPTKPDTPGTRMIISTYLQGLGIGLSLIVAIGAQNAFVLTQSLKRQHHLPVALVCALIDIILISLGVLGLGALIAQSRLLSLAASLGGAIFLFYFGFKSLLAAENPGSLEAQKKISSSLRQTLLTTLALSLLNPHVYLDTVVMLGALSSHYVVPDRYLFAAGAMTASIVWFMSLALAGKILAPYFKNPTAWRILYLLVALLVWWIALGLARNFIAALH